MHFINCANCQILNSLLMISRWLWCANCYASNLYTWMKHRFIWNHKTVIIYLFSSFLFSQTNHEQKHTRWRPPQIVTKQDWHERLKGIRIGKKSVDNTEKADNSAMSFPIFDENLYPKSPKSTSEAKVRYIGHIISDEASIII